MNKHFDPARVLIVEDEMMVAMLLEDMLEELGYEVVGPVSRLDQAIASAAESTLTAAILDLNLNGEHTYAVADVLRKRGLPFIFATGYGESGVSARFRDVPVLQKPFQRAELARALDMALGRATTNV